MTNKKYWMGGGGNQKWGGYSEPAKGTTPTGGATPSDKGGGIVGDSGGISDFTGNKGGKGDKKGGAKGEPSGQKREPKGELSDKDKAKKEFAQKQSNTPEAKAARERQATLKAMTPQARADHFASKKMFDRHISKEYSKWQKAGSPGGHQKGWVEGKLPELGKQWASGGQKKWMGSNAKQATSIRDKAQREEAYKAGKRGDPKPIFKNKPIKATKKAKAEKKTKPPKEMSAKTWKQNRVKGHGAIKDFKIHTPLSKSKK